MTNAEKYLKDEVAITDFIIAFRKWYYAEERILKSVDKEIENFLREKVQPTLTEDERVILRNIDKKFIKVGRDSANTIYFVFVEFMGNEAKYHANVFDNVFQFIEYGEEYSIEELLKGE